MLREFVANGFEARNESNIGVALFADPFCENLTRNAWDWGVAGRVDLADDYEVAIVERSGEFLHAIPRACVAVGLKDADDSTRVNASRRSQRCLQFCRVVGIVVDDSNVAGKSQELVASLDATKARKSLSGFLEGDIEFEGYCNASQGVEDIVIAGKGEANIAKGATLLVNRESNAFGVLTHLAGDQFCIRRESVGGQVSLASIRDGPNPRVIDADHGQSPERNRVGESDEGTFQGGKVPIVIEMFGINVRDHGDHRFEEEEGAVTFIGFGDENGALTQAGSPRTRVIADDPASDD